MNGPQVRVTVPCTISGPCRFQRSPIEIWIGPRPTWVPADRRTDWPVPDSDATTVAVTTSVAPVDAATRIFFQRVIRCLLGGNPAPAPQVRGHSQLRRRSRRPGIAAFRNAQ